MNTRVAMIQFSITGNPFESYDFSRESLSQATRLNIVLPPLDTNADIYIGLAIP